MKPKIILCLALLAAIAFVYDMGGNCKAAITDPKIESSSQNGPGRAAPFIRLEKKKYVLGEQVRFWIGVNVKNLSVITPVSKDPGSLFITKPDGTQEVQPMGWPIDGSPGGSWSGGWGFGDKPVEPGRYTLVFEWKGVKTSPTELMVVQNDILRQIKAEFRFERQGIVSENTPVPMVLTVQNGTAMTIRFPQRGVTDNGVGIIINRKEPAYYEDTFYPWEKLCQSKYSVDTYTWDDDSDIPSVVLRPGERFEQRFLLKDAYSPDRAGDYEITIRTVLPILVGEKNGEFAAICPIRVPVTASAKLMFKSK